jgi:hypothetical protein
MCKIGGSRFIEGFQSLAICILYLVNYHKLIGYLQYTTLPVAAACCGLLQRQRSPVPHGDGIVRITIGNLDSGC